ncbi:hypothetical protein RB628_40750, partial [Streptomyces sp. ADMS]|uniref:hypothetical protein n=1 Tax=Streptomyces sp. ADMS TaxID=3071415 RepID=UPI00296EED49
MKSPTTRSNFGWNPVPRVGDWGGYPEHGADQLGGELLRVHVLLVHTSKGILAVFDTAFGELLAADPAAFRV